MANELKLLEFSPQEVPKSGSDDREELPVLLIEDNPGDVRLVEYLLATSDMFHCRIVNKTSLQEGLAALSQTDFPVVLLDLTLPDSSGFGTLQKLITAFPETNVIVLTGLADKALGLKTVKAGAQDFLMKGGFDADLLAKTLRYSIDRKSVLQRLTESQRAREVAEESARLKEQFIAGVSHEMRTPMNAIYGMSHLLALTPLNEEQKGYIHSIRQSSEVLLGVINDILEFSTLQNGKIEFTHETFDLTELLYNVVNVMQYKRDEKDILFALHMDEGVPQKVKGDKLRLNQILYNIVGNAIKFTDEGFIKIHVELAEETETEALLHFSVEDSGVGIPADKIDGVFDAFTRVHSKDRLFEGAGLGLAIVKNLVAQQGGSIGAKSELGVGTTVFFELRFSKAPPDVLEVETEAPVAAQDALRSFSMLLVEDHKINQLVARKTLERHFPNIILTVANHGKEALEVLKTTLFDIILMDIQMPVMDGNETTAFIRRHMPEVKAPILAMTAHAYISRNEVFKTYGFDDYVLKPFEPEQFFTKIHYYLDLPVR